MLASTLYSKFPTITYSNQIVTDITVRLKFQEMVRNNLVLFYPYTVEEGERADIIAHTYYGDASYSWLIYLANDIYDPHTEWHKTSAQLDKHIAQTYGSIPAAYQKTMFYRVDWASDESILNISAYNALPSTNKKYWTPTLDGQLRIVSYERAREDWIVDTNQIIKITTRSPIDASEGELIYQQTGGSVSASGEITLIEGNYVFLRHISGEFLAGGKTIVKDDVSVGLCDAVEQIYSAFEPEEANYWAPVSAYDYEMELNEAKKSIRLIDSAYVETIERDIRTILAP